MDSVRICSLAIAGQRLSIIRQVDGLCLGLTGRLRGKTGQKVRGQAPYVDPAPEKVGVNWPPGPRGSAVPAAEYGGKRPPTLVLFSVVMTRNIDDRREFAYIIYENISLAKWRQCRRKRLNTTGIQYHKIVWICVAVYSYFGDTLWKLFVLNVLREICTD